MAETTTQTTEAKEKKFTRNTSPIVLLLKKLAEEKFIDWANGGTLSFVAKVDGKQVGKVVPLTEFTGKFTDANIQTIINNHNPMDAKERKVREVERHLRSLGMNDAADEVVKKFQDEKASQAASAQAG